MTERIAVVTTRDRTVEITRSLGEIDLDNLEREVKETGGEAIWWGVLHAQAVAEAERAKIRRDVARAVIGKEIKTRCQSQGEQRVTERMLDDGLVQDSRYQQALEEVIQAEESAAILYSTRTAIERKDRKLEVVGGLIRQEVGATREPLLPKQRREPVR